MTGKLSNQIKVLIQRARMAHREPWKIIMPKAMRWALEQELQPAMVGYKKTDQGHYYGGLFIVIDNSVTEPIILIKPEMRAKPLELAVKGSKYATAYH